MIVSVNHNFEYSPETTSFLIDTDKLDDIENFKEKYDADLSDDELDRIHESRKLIREKLESEDEVIGWGYDEETTCEGFAFYELIEGSTVSHPVRVLKNISVFEK